MLVCQCHNRLMNTTPHTTGARVLIAALHAQGVDTVFCVPGESFLDAIDALYAYRDRIRLVVCRHEGSATFMAEAYAKASGKPGVCFVTRAPGATQASIGVHTAHQDGTPLILFIGQVNRHFMERGAFQEVDYRQMFGPMSKWVAQIETAGRMQEMVSRAFHTALSGRMGPVVLSLPEDVLSERLPAPAAAVPTRIAHAAPSAGDLQTLAQWLGQAQRPVLVLGGSGWTQEAVADIAQFAQASGLPVACSFRRQDLFDHRDPHYAGLLGLGSDPVLHQAVQEADVLFLLGARMGEVPSNGYTLIDVPQPKQTVVHCMPCASELGRVYNPALGIVAGMPAMAASLAAMALPTDMPARLQTWRRRLRSSYEAFSEAPSGAPAAPPTEGTLAMTEAWLALRQALPPDTVVTNGAGNYAAWAHRYYRYPNFGSQVAPTSGAMGYGLPAAIGSQMARPERPVLCLAGDGCFMMSAHELATAVHLQLRIVVVVFDNQMFGTIRMHQEKWFPHNVYGTGLHNPDFAALARSFGAKGIKVETVAQLCAEVVQGLTGNGPTLIHVQNDPEQVSPSATLCGLRAKALASAP